MLMQLCMLGQLWIHFSMRIWARCYSQRPPATGQIANGPLLATEWGSTNVEDSKGKEVDLSTYKGKVLLVVNVASKCGLADSNYTKLTEVYNKYKEKGLEIFNKFC